MVPLSPSVLTLSPVKPKCSYMIHLKHGTTYQKTWCLLICFITDTVMPESHWQKHFYFAQDIMWQFVKLKVILFFSPHTHIHTIGSDVILKLTNKIVKTRLVKLLTFCIIAPGN